MSARIYKVFVPKQAAGASLVYFDLFVPTNSIFRVEVLALQPIVSGAVAVTGVLGIDLFLRRTTAIGTGGTLMTQEGTSLTAMTISDLNGQQIADAAAITGRLAPAGGATGGAVLNWTSVFTEETNSAAYNLTPDMIRNFYADIPAMAIPPNSGFSVIGGPEAGPVGNIGFNIFLRTKTM